MISTSPFHRSDGSIDFPYIASSDRCFIYPSPPPESFGEGIIQIPEHLQEFYAEGYGILLSVGLGFYHEKGHWISVSPRLQPGVKVHFDIGVPWEEFILGPNGERHRVVLCGVTDIWGVVEED